MKLKTIALLTVVTLLISQVLLVEGNKQKGKKERQKGAGEEEKQKAPTRNEDKEKGAGKEEKQKSSTRNRERERGSKESKGGKGSLQGKFLSKDKEECIWSVSGTETMALNVECTKGETKVSCAYSGNPTACPNYATNHKAYWKQVIRALKKKKNICQDQKAVLKSKECKKGPPEAHLSYITSTMSVANHEHKVQEAPKPTTKVNTTETTKDCVEDVDVIERQRLAKEYCGSSWSSFCSFFFSMVQGSSC